MRVQSTTQAASQETWPQIRIESWAELQRAIDPLAVRCVFRGQGSHEWPLTSSFNRLVSCEDEARALDWERRTILQFRSQAHLYLPPSVVPPNPFKLAALDTYVEWLMIMQHYGAPTRLLDWSCSPYVAIYFAVIDCRAEDAAVWFFDARSASEALCRRFGYAASDMLDYADLDAEEVRRIDAVPFLFTAEKKFRTAREVAQQGVFSFVNRLAADHQSVIPQSCAGSDFGRVIIPKELKTEICSCLQLMNVTAAALFPGVEGVCSAIRDGLRLAVANLPTGSSVPPPLAQIAQAE